MKYKNSQQLLMFVLSKCWLLNICGVQIFQTCQNLNFSIPIFLLENYSLFQQIYPRNQIGKMKRKERGREIAKTGEEKRLHVYLHVIRHNLEEMTMSGSITKMWNKTLFSIKIFRYCLQSQQARNLSVEMLPALLSKIIWTMLVCRNSGFLLELLNLTQR